MGAAHFSSAVLAPAVVDPPALPVATVLAEASPIFMLVVSQADKRPMAATKVKVSLVSFMSKISIWKIGKGIKAKQRLGSSNQCTTEPPKLIN